MLFMNFSSGYR